MCYSKSMKSNQTRPYFCSSSIISTQYNNILKELKFSLYLRGVEMRYWDNPIIIGEKLRERYRGTAGAYFFPISTIYCGKGRLVEMLLQYVYYMKQIKLKHLKKTNIRNKKRLGFPHPQLHFFLDLYYHLGGACNFSVENSLVSFLPEVPHRIHQGRL